LAKARDIPGFDGRKSFRAVARETVEIRSREVFEHAAGVLDTEDIERVHDMRVATRRLRAVLEVFAPAFDRHEHKAVLRDVKALADALGERRDADVEIAMLEGLPDEAAAADRDALRDLIEELRVRQVEANEALASYVTKKRLTKLRRRLKRLVKEAGE
jgi:CHAD domain-containing protein